MSYENEIAVKTNDIQCNPCLLKCINKIIENERFIEHQTNVRSISTHGGNYLGDLFEVNITGKTEQGIQEINLFVKKIRELENTTVLPSNEVHSREIKAYEEILPLYEELEKEANVPKEKRFKHIKVYGSDDELLIFENLSYQGYKTLHRMDVMSADYAKLVIEQLAKFHALSFVLKQKRPEYFEENIRKLHNPFNFVDVWKKFVAEEIKMACTFLDDEPRTKLEAASNKIVENFATYVQNSSMALCHGDFRINNVLHREEYNKITDVRPIDFQIIYNGHPLNDFMYLIFPSTDKQFRKDHLQDIKAHYYESLEDHLKYFDIAVEDVFPRTKFEEDYKERLFYGLMVTIMMLPILFRRDIDDNDTKKPISFNLDPRARDRVRDVVDDFIDWGYL